MAAFFVCLKVEGCPVLVSPPLAGQGEDFDFRRFEKLEARVPKEV
jgi:hypothetical protein